MDPRIVTRRGENDCEEQTHILRTRTNGCLSGIQSWDSGGQQICRFFRRTQTQVRYHDRFNHRVYPRNHRHGSHGGCLRSYNYSEHSAYWHRSIAGSDPSIASAIELSGRTDLFTNRIPTCNRTREADPNRDSKLDLGVKEISVSMRFS